MRLRGAFVNSPSGVTSGAGPVGSVVSALGGVLVLTIATPPFHIAHPWRRKSALMRLSASESDGVPLTPTKDPSRRRCNLVVGGLTVLLDDETLFHREPKQLLHIFVLLHIRP
jgi:hypothetical protein